MTESTRRAWPGLAALMLALALCLFLPAGSLRYPEAWLYLALFGASAAAITGYLQRYDPALLQRRAAAGPGAETERSQRIIQSVASLAFVATFIVAALDHRHGWSAVPAPVVAAGDLLLLLGFGLVFLAFRENSYASATIETVERQPVIDTGPYAVVRHPMYTGALLLLLGTPPALGSYWALLCVLGLAAAIVARLLDEERFLSRRLPGYDAYRAKVRYRLLPFLW